jgi:hypothetical protein
MLQGSVEVPRRRLAHFTRKIAIFSKFSVTIQFVDAEAPVARLKSEGDLAPQRLFSCYDTLFSQCFLVRDAHEDFLD